MSIIKKAVFPVGGLGTRFLPATKAMPKEMLPIVDKPLIQYAVEEAIAAGIQEIIFVTGRNKSAIEDHFDRSFELETMLKATQKDHNVVVVNSPVLQPGSITYTRQQAPLGLGHAVWCARHFINNEPFAVLLADDFIIGKDPCIKQMIEAYDKLQSNIIAVTRVDQDNIHQYGIIDPDKEAISDSIVKINAIVEKPNANKAPSNIAVVGRYILEPQIVDLLAEQNKGLNNEIELTDAIAKLIKQQNCYGLFFQGQRIDCGSKIGYIKANLTMAMQYPEMAQEIKNMMRKY